MTSAAGRHGTEFGVLLSASDSYTSPYTLDCSLGFLEDILPVFPGTKRSLTMKRGLKQGEQAVQGRK